MLADDPHFEESELLQELGLVLAGKALARSPQLQAMLKYMVTETLAGRADKLKAYAIAVDVLGRDSSFDPATDAIVRVQAGRLRTALESHYAGEGRQSPIRITLPKGTYVPVFLAAGRTSPGASGEASDAVEPDNAQPHAEVESGQSRSLIEAPPALGNGAGQSWRPSTAHLALIAVAVVLTAIVYLTMKGLPHRQPAARAADPPQFNRLVIAQFTSLEAAADQQRLADALTAELVTSLTRSPLVELQLSAAESPGAGDELRQLARDRNAHWALTGVLRRAGNRQRLNVFVVDAVAGRVAWSQDYDVTPDDALPEKLADAVILDLRPQLYLLAKRALERKPNPTPSELFVLANWSPGIETNSLAWQLERIALARRAIEADPQFGPAHSVLADKLSLLALFIPAYDTAAIWTEADAAARQAGVLTPHSSEIAFNLALYHLHSGRIEDAERWVRRTLELAPRHTLARFWVSALPYFCRAAPADVIAELTRFDAALSPPNPARWQTKVWLARLQLNGGDFPAAISAAQQSMQIVPNLGAALILIAALVQTGDVEAARRVYLDQQQYWAGFSLAHYNDASLPRMCRSSPGFEALRKVHRDAAEALR